MALSQPPLRDSAFRWPITWAAWFTDLWRLASTIGQHGTTAQRPTAGLFVGRPYWDDTLGRPIWWNGLRWVDSAGVAV